MLIFLDPPEGHQIEQSTWWTMMQYFEKKVVHEECTFVVAAATFENGS
jgi:hypothetical protein